MNILGLDLSLTASGWCVVDEKMKVLDSGCIKSKKRGVERLAEIRHELHEIVNQSLCDKAVLEGYGFNPFGGSDKMLAELGGVIKHLLFKREVPYYVIAPCSLKLFATGSGKAHKSEVMLAIYKKYKVEFPTEDEADAFVLAAMGQALQMSKEKLSTLPEWQIRAIQPAKIDKGGNNYDGSAYLKSSKRK